jgi:hypothetical protein
MTTINAIHTPCKDCIFASYEDKTQTDCLLHYIDIFKKNNVEVLEVYDNDKEFYVINNKKCIGYRDSKWVKNMGLEDSTMEMKIAKFQETNSLDYLAIINLRSLDSLESLAALYAKLATHKFKPKKIIFIRYKDHAQDKFTFKAIEEIFKQYDPIPWLIQSIIDEDLSYNTIIGMIISLHKSQRFVLLINNSDPSILDIIDDANKLVYEDMGQFTALGDDRCKLVPGSVFRYAKHLGFNILEPITDDQPEV